MVNSRKDPKANSSLPLQGLTILEMGSSIAGPFAGRIFGDFGATVLKVEPPEIGDASRNWGKGQIGGTGAAYQVFNKEKRSIIVDFADQVELDNLLLLIAKKVDIVIQNLRPGVVEKFGLDAKTVMKGNGSLIYCNMGAFGAFGPMKAAPGYDPLIQAFTGIADATGEVGGEAVRVGVPLIDIGTGMWAAIGILSALQQRSVTGRGCLVDAAMFETGLAWQSMNFANYEAGAGWPERTGLQGPMVMPNDGYEASDGKLMLTIGTPLQFKRFCEVIGCCELLVDPLFSTNNARLANKDVLKSKINKALGKRKRGEWSLLLDVIDVPNAPIQSLREAVEHPQTVASDIIQNSPDGSFRLFGMPLRFDGVRPGFRSQAPELGEATQETFDFMTDPI